MSAPFYYDADGNRVCTACDKRGVLLVGRQGRSFAWCPHCKTQIDLDPPEEE